MTDEEYLQERASLIAGDSFDNTQNLDFNEALKIAKKYIEKENKKDMNIVHGKIKKAQKIIIYGEPGAGKSTLASKFPNALFIDVEQSANQLEVARVIIDSWDKLLLCLGEAKNLPEYDTIIIDTLDVVEAFCASKFKIQILAPKDYGRSFVALEEKFKEEILIKLDAIINNGKNVVLLAHNEVKKIELPENEGQYDRHELRLTKKVKALFEGWCDALFFIYRKSFIVEGASGKNKAQGGKKRWLETNSNTFCVAKCRWEIEDNFEASIKNILPHLPMTGEKSEEVKVKSEKVDILKNENATNQDETSTQDEPRHIQDFRKFLELDVHFSDEEILAYLKGKNSRKTKFVQDDIEFKSIEKTLIDKMTISANWAKIKTDLLKNRE